MVTSHQPQVPLAHSLTPVNSLESQSAPREGYTQHRHARAFSRVDFGGALPIARPETAPFSLQLIITLHDGFPDPDTMISDNYCKSSPSTPTRRETGKSSGTRRSRHDGRAVLGQIEYVA